MSFWDVKYVSSKVPSTLSVTSTHGSTKVSPTLIRIVSFPLSVIVGGVVSTTFTVRVCVEEVFPCVSLTVYLIVCGAFNSVVLTSPTIVTVILLALSKLSLRIYCPVLLNGVLYSWVIVVPFLNVSVGGVVSRTIIVLVCAIPGNRLLYPIGV